MFALGPIPGGHCKFLHLWPVQNPPRARRDRRTLGGVGALGKTGSRLLQPPALAVELEQVSVVHQTVEQRRDDDDIAEQGGPVIEWSVGSDDGGTFLIAAHQDIGELVASGGR